MFDYVSVADKLPVTQEMIDAGFGENTLVYQTKDLDRMMAKYYIQGGRLIQQRYKSVLWVEDDRSFAGGHLSRLDPYTEDCLGFTGTLRFYTVEYRGNDSYWIDYRAMVAEGKVQTIELVKFEKRDETERNKLFKELVEKHAEECGRWYNKYIFHTDMWETVRRFLVNTLTLVERGCSKLKFKIP